MINMRNKLNILISNKVGILFKDEPNKWYVGILWKNGLSGYELRSDVYGSYQEISFKMSHVKTVRRFEEDYG